MHCIRSLAYNIGNNLVAYNFKHTVYVYERIKCGQKLKKRKALLFVIPLSVFYCIFCSLL